MTSKQAYTVASQWGSLMRDGDPGAVFYTFPADVAVVQDADHRAKLIAYTEDCLVEAITTLHTAVLVNHDYSNMVEQSQNVRDLVQLKGYFTVVPLESDMSPFLKGYMEAMLFTATDDAGNDLNREYSITDFSADAIKAMSNDCNTFLLTNAVLVAEVFEQPLPSGVHCSDAEYAGHNFAFTRNGHGTGFWDRGYPKALGDALTEASKAFGESYVWMENDVLGVD